MTGHATEQDLTAWLPTGVDIDEPARLLDRASVLVDQYVRAPYDPADEATLQALSDATCATVEAWIETGEENDLDGLAGTQMSVPGYSGHRAVALPPRAYRALSQAGLIQPVG